MAWFFEDEADPYSDSILELCLRGRPVVPVLWCFEMANVLLAAERQKRLSRLQSSKIIQQLRSFPLEIDQAYGLESLRGLMEFGRDYKLSTYDAAYLELAVRRDLPIASTDDKLCAAAGRCGIKLVVR